MKKCPYCAEEIQGEAIKCKHCGEMLNEAEYKKDKSKSTEGNREDLREKQKHNIETGNIKNEKKYIKCPHCTKMMSIDAATCQHCGKSGGFSYSYMLTGMIIGLIGSVLFFYITTGGEDFFSSAICGMCICNPIFWGFAIGGAIIGGIVGEIKKNKIKQQK